MRDRLTKAQVQTLFAAVDGPLDALVAALGDAVCAVYGPGSLDHHLRRLGREATASAIAARDVDAIDDLAAELNERRRLD